ncbi:MFS transporter [Arthrobacter sp. zg-Y844]|uniref:MFS transporter n=1 Tax=Arthrobacter sp. zg-Y844 TaxID=2964612 RepID=UPI0021064797|nr:MFS transporter [Arthrobacter sp. zg-Y844]MCQ1987605.1 MFS transporter [Arthrobacter sp. zg-Y844]
MQAEHKVNTGRDRAGFWSRRYLPTNVGLFTLAFLFAFESLAVGTVMPVVARELDGLSLYGLAFGAPMATAVVTIALAGGWTDARGPAPALRTGVVLFSVGIAAAALAPSMVMLVLGRSLQGLGAGLGLLLTVSAVAWFAGSLAAANLAVLANKVARVRLGALFLAVGIGAAAWSVDPQMSILLPVLGWAVAGAGIGMAFPTLSVLMLDFSAEGEEGTNSSSLQVNDNLVQSLWLALGTVAFALMLPVTPLGAFIGAFASAAGLAAAALALSGRLASPRSARS